MAGKRAQAKRGIKATEPARDAQVHCRHHRRHPKRRRRVSLFLQQEKPYHKRQENHHVLLHGRQFYANQRRYAGGFFRPARRETR